MKIKEYLFKNIKNIIIVLLTIIIVLLIVIIIKVDNKNSYVNPYKVEVFKNDNFLFLGDSITDFYPLDEYYDELPVVNSGISGNKTNDILADMKKRVYQYNPTKVFLLIGTNDLNSNDENIVNKTYKNTIKIIENIKQNRSEAKIYIESVYPINDKMDNNLAEERTNSKTKKLNKKLKKYCDSTEDCVYIDLYSKLIDEDGNLKEKYSTDGLHLNTLGYVVITRELLPYLNEK